jgi:hypothetical protein
MGGARQLGQNYQEGLHGAFIKEQRIVRAAVRNYKRLSQVE